VRGVLPSYDDVKRQIENGEGCEVNGHVFVHKVPGNIHFSIHNEKMTEIVQRLQNDGIYLNYAHKILDFTFGTPDAKASEIQRKFPEIVLYPLEGSSMNEEIRLAIAYQYYLNVVRAKVMLRGEEVEAYQYTISRSFGITRDFPALFFKYEMSPLYVRYELKEKSIWHFLVNICAIIGGVYTAFSILDAIIYSSVSRIFKHRIGKLS